MKSEEEIDKSAIPEKVGGFGIQKSGRGLGCRKETSTVTTKEEDAACLVGGPALGVGGGNSGWLSSCGLYFPYRWVLSHSLRVKGK